MRALQLVQFGDPPQLALREVPEPQPAAGEVVVELRAAALNRRDPWVWSSPGYCRLPVTLGSDGAGVVVARAPDVEGIALGQEVIFDATLGWGELEERPSEAFDILGAPRDGTFAERVAIPAANVVAKPARLSWEEAAAVNLAGLTAWRAVVSCAQARAGSTLLVTGAGGGVSTFAIQIAVARGVRVLVTSSRQKKLERALSLGAAHAVSYRDPRWPALIRELEPGGVDAAIDGYGGPSWEGALVALRPGGTLVSFGDTHGPTTTLTTAEVYWRWRRVIGTSMGSPREYRAMVRHVTAASWRPAIDSVFALDEFQAAIARLQDPDRFGKVVLSIT